MYTRSRRCIDASVAFVLLILSLPILVAAAICVRLEDGGPVIFRQERVGRFGRLFKMYKLRTMLPAKCRDDHSPGSSQDPRLTRVGLWLRKTSIDELPQLFNVLRGDMALVGPRPEMPFLVQQFEEWQHLRHFVTPGITGLWQTTAREIPLHKPESTKLDLEYIARAGHLTDSVILYRTALSVVRARGAY
jgi:lipopolysaccharide/colanic/teichoic acid biosynthesis glycosyltransferase